MTEETMTVRPVVATSNKTSLKTAALVSGLGLLIMVVTSPIAELYIFPKLISSGNAAQTVKNIYDHMPMFVMGIFDYLITFIADIVVAWALYIFLKPVSKNLSLLTGLFRLVYTVIALIALLNLVAAFRFLTTPTYRTLFGQDGFNNQILVSYYTFKSYWYFGILFFAIHLGLLGYLSLISKYIPKILGILLLVSALGYLLTTVQPFFFPGKRIDFAKYTFYGELFFMLWLLIKGWRVQVKTDAGEI